MKFVKQLFYLVALSFSAIFFEACSDNSETVKPLGQVRLEYPQPKYLDFKENAPYFFQYSDFGIIEKGKKPNWFIIHYPKMKANIFLTYFPITSKEDLVLNIKDSEKFVQEQTIKASFISPQVFEFPEKRVFGTL